MSLHQSRRSSDQKSRKRRAAEAKLAALHAERALGTAGSPSATPSCICSAAKRRRQSGGQILCDPLHGWTTAALVPVPPCGCPSSSPSPCCSPLVGHSPLTVPRLCDGDQGAACPWKDLSLRVPQVDPHQAADRNLWRARQPVDQESGEASSSSRCPPVGQLLGVCDVLVVETEAELTSAISQLRESMRDQVISVDLEWCSDGRLTSRRGGSRVALMQLSTSSLCVLIRTCKMAFQLPEDLQEFLRDPSLCFVGFSWGTDERKMRESFRWDRQDFGRLLDLQAVADRLGYRRGCGLVVLASWVLGFSLPKSKKITLSNWEAKQLSDMQVQYAALDAFITGHLFRCLGMWHSSPSVCHTCKTELGLPVSVGLCCAEPSCGKHFRTADALDHHSQSTGHLPAIETCRECGRWSDLAGGSSRGPSPSPSLEVMRASASASLL